MVNHYIKSKEFNVQRQDIIPGNIGLYVGTKSRKKGRLSTQLEQQIYLKMNYRDYI